MAAAGQDGVQRAWRKLGLAFAPPGRGRMTSHAMLPTPVVLEDRIRVLFASCDEHLRGRVYAADFDRAPPFRLMRVSHDPVLDLGDRGAFDADGVNPCHVVERDGDWYLYYIGWRRHSAEVPYTLFAGLAVSTDRGASFTRLGSEPILPPRPGERYFRTAPFVRREGSRFEMFYIGGNDFFASDSGKLLPIYALKHHFSPDGVTWTESSQTLLAPDPAAGEIGFGRPYLWESPETGPVLMISVRTVAGYRLAELPISRAPLESSRLRPVIAGGPDAWDSEMTCFGAPCRVDEHELLFYNGNGMGRSGFGYAVRTALRSWPITEAGS